jgi:hypothetical protein
MKLLIACLVLCLTGCTTVPITAKFPQVPNELMQKCPSLAKLSDDTKLSEIAKTVTSNYTSYHECSIKLDAWIEWYGIQKQIYESVK